MAGKTLGMGQVKQLIRLHQQGDGIKSIARKLGMGRNTVRAYLQKVQTGELSLGALLALEDPVLEGQLFAGPPSYKAQRYGKLSDDISYYADELKKTGVTRKLLWEEYISKHPDGYRYTQFCYHLGQYLLAKNPTMVLHHRPGEKLFIDFTGKPLSYIDHETGEIIDCQVFVACLPYSDYCFAMAVRSQGTEDFLYALRCCLEDIGGVPQALVPDNLKAAINKADRYEPDINRVMEDFANHYGTTVVPARVRKPQDKALVENQVKLIYSRVYARLRKQQFFDLPSLNKALSEKVKDHNQTRMQEQGYCREEKFLSDEKHLLKPLPGTRFEIKHYKQLKVAKNNHIRLTEDKHYYSVPYRLTGQDVKVIYTRSIVRIYAGGKLVAAHQRSYKTGGYTTVKEHLCSQHQFYLDRSPDYYKRQARKKSPSFYRVVERIFNQEKYPEQLYRSCDGLLSLQRQTAPEIFEKACLIALEYDNCTYGFIKNMLENKMAENIETNPTNNKKSLPAHENLRGAACYK